MSAAPAERRLARILAIVPWVAAADGPLISEVCARFGVEEAELLADLELLLYCGVHPFTPDTLIEVDLVDGRVWLRFADYFRRPLRLSAPEGLALLGAGAALLAVPGVEALDQTGAPRLDGVEATATTEPATTEPATDGALARALTKL
jgi:proteasome accessory factor C